MYTMSWFCIGRIALAAVFASVVGAQQSGWQVNQVNATMCAWRALRGKSIINDQIIVKTRCFAYVFLLIFE